MNRTKTVNKFLSIIMFSLLVSCFSCKKTTNQELRDQELSLRTGYIEKYHRNEIPVYRGVYVIPDKNQPKDQVKDAIVDKDVVRVYYEGYLLEQTKDGVNIKKERFDGNFDYKTGKEKYDPYTVTVVDQELHQSARTTEISGWHVALTHMHIGERAEVIIPSSQAYSIKGNGSIGPYQTLVFFMEVKEKASSSSEEPIVE
ncbi:FKBP-type peptidyl-prolyl cis-trans isomerase [Halosquirtibacter laminarini]|uniref:FKBP-type peptidyl-prolyl cis-trans isomerase n=1 Tax=Halosquirtibacter laminarini TaxID=3374600 RepID=A0AC61NIP4_9BACT|nr:FKBP-type peptidyl-prolyl cis-trans isomerase [Prolixibacteraceae bacterium]